MSRIGILQGRLSPPAARAQTFPQATWRGEFATAAACGFDAVEWLVTAADFEANPLWTVDGLHEMRHVARSTGVAIPSVCADLFIECPLVRVSPAERLARIDMLAHLIVQTANAGAGVLLLPFLERNALSDDGEADDVLRAIAAPLAAASRVGLYVAIESDWSGDRLRTLIRRSGQPALAAYYDIGNAVTHGNDAERDIRELGSLIRGVHVKDRRRGGGSAPLGSGDAPLASAFAALTDVGFDGIAILETPAGDDPIASARENLRVARQHASRLGVAAR